MVSKVRWSDSAEGILQVLTKVDFKPPSQVAVQFTLLPNETFSFFFSISVWRR